MILTRKSRPKKMSAEQNTNFKPFSQKCFANLNSLISFLLFNFFHFSIIMIIILSVTMDFFHCHYFF